MSDSQPGAISAETAGVTRHHMLLGAGAGLLAALTGIASLPVVLVFVVSMLSPWLLLAAGVSLLASAAWLRGQPCSRLAVICWAVALWALLVGVVLWVLIVGLSRVIDPLPELTPGFLVAALVTFGAVAAVGGSLAGALAAWLCRTPVRTAGPE